MWSGERRPAGRQIWSGERERHGQVIDDTQSQRQAASDAANKILASFGYKLPETLARSGQVQVVCGDSGTQYLTLHERAADHQIDIRYQSEDIRLKHGRKKLDLVQNMLSITMGS